MSRMLNFWPFYIHEVWRNRLAGCRRVVLFGAGRHSHWLIDTVAAAGGPEIVALVDDRADQIRELKGLPVVKPAQVSDLRPDAVVISSDTAEDELTARARECFPGVRIVQLYENLPPGPYDKEYQLQEGTPSPVDAVNLETVVAVARSVETKERLIEVMGTLNPDIYIDPMIEGYRGAIQKYGRNWRYTDLISLLYAYSSLAKPRRYLEVGTRRGHSLAAVCAASVAAGNDDLEVVCCDLWIDNYLDSANPGPQFVTGQMARVGYDKPIHFLSGSSHELLPEFLDDPARTFDLITVDGDHSREGATMDLLNVIDSLGIGGMLAFDDINHPRASYLHDVWKTVIAGRWNLETYANPRDHTGVAAAIRYR